MAESRGKQSYRDFIRTVNETKGWIIRAIREGEVYTLDNINRWYSDLLTVWSGELDDERLDFELWFPRGVSKVETVINDLQDRYPDSIQSPDDTEPDSEDDDSEIPPDEWTDDNGLLGYPVISTEECLATDSSSRVRGVVFVTLEELASYIEEIPPEVIRGIVVTEGPDNTLDFSICAGDTR